MRSGAASGASSRTARKSGCHLGDDIGAGRRHHQDIGIARQIDMSHLVFIGQREQIVIDFIFGERGKAQRRDELGTAFGQNATHQAALLAYASDQVGDLNRRDAA